MLHVLIAEDDATVRELVAQMVRNLGCIVEAVPDGVEAVRAFSESLASGDRYHIVFCDILMPRLDGHRTVIAIRDLEKKARIPPADETRIVMTSVLDDPYNVIKSMYEGGAYTYLPKPFREEELAKEIRIVRERLGHGPVQPAGQRNAT